MSVIKTKKLSSFGILLLLGCFCLKATAATTTDSTAVSTDSAATTTDSTTATDSATAVSTDSQDPFEIFNRASFNFNQKFDQVVLTPVAQAYNYVLPQPVRTGVTNVYNNIDEIPTVANDLLQFNFLQAMNDSWRFFLNSTAGIFGIFDIAKQIGLPPHYTDFGLTLAKWGCTDSPYLVLPFLGPGTVRDQIGVPIDYYFLSPYGYLYPRTTRGAIVVLNVVQWRANALDFANVIAEASFDPYVFQRNAYLQRRNYLIQQTLAEKPFYIPNLDAVDTTMPSTDNDPMQASQ